MYSAKTGIWQSFHKKCLCIIFALSTAMLLCQGKIMACYNHL
jgi:hypothetical protein